MDDVADLVLLPFREMVEKGRTAIDNADGLQPMLTAAHKLVKEGERALERIEPICQKKYYEYGPKFLAALRANEQITQHRLELTDLLWDFNSYVKVDNFDSERFVELQALSRAAAPKMRDILLTMEIEAPMRFNPGHFMSQLSPPSSPQALPPPVLGKLYSARGSASSSRTDNGFLGEMRLVESPIKQLDLTMDRTESHDNASGSAHSALEKALPPAPRPVEEPPRPPSTDPWDINVAAVADDGKLGDGTAVKRRSSVEPIEIASLVSPRSGWDLPVPQSNRSSGKACSLGPVQVIQHNGDTRHQSISSQPPNDSVCSLHGRETPTRMIQSPAPKIPERRRGMTSEARSQSRTLSNTYSSSPVQPHRSDQVLWPTPSEARQHSAGESPRNDLPSNSSPRLAKGRAPSIESLLDPNPFTVHAAAIDDATSATVKPELQSGPGLARRPPIMPIDIVDHGLIPVETTPTATPLLLHLPQRDCSIDNSSSSFYLHKGFCKGAEEVVNGGIGVKKTKKPVGFSSSATVARCTHCLYELDFREIELDVAKQDEGNYTKNGVGFRLRFLQKSHIHAKRADDIMYGCVFCIHLGRTLDKSDATVFTTTSALFSHLARHHRPLPEVHGIAVVDQVELPAGLRNDYDVHFKNPPEAHPALYKAADIAVLPTGVAREHARRLFGQKLLPDRTPALELVQGARVTGLTWPSRYNGEWCFGWHDGVHASLPTEILKLDRPPLSQIKRSGASRVRAKARWKFAPKDKDKEDWLKFDKDEMISNITWSYSEHWCWAGTNAKGKWGIFPQVFIDTNTVQELTPAGSDRAIVLSNEKNKSSSILPRFSMRAKAGRPPSIAGSTSSGEATTRPMFSGSRSSRRSRGDDGRRV